MMDNPPNAPGTARYAVVANRIRAAIAEGIYGPGEQLPAESALAVAHDVSHMTVRAALRVLRGEGLVETRHGQGTFVAATNPAAATQPREERDQGRNTTVLVLCDAAGRQLRRIVVDHHGPTRVTTTDDQSDTVIRVHGVTDITDRQHID